MMYTSASALHIHLIVYIMDIQALAKTAYIEFPIAKYLESPTQRKFFKNIAT